MGLAIPVKWQERKRPDSPLKTGRNRALLTPRRASN